MVDLPANIRPTGETSRWMTDLPGGKRWGRLCVVQGPRLHLSVMGNSVYHLKVREEADSDGVEGRSGTVM